MVLNRSPNTISLKKKLSCALSAAETVRFFNTFLVNAVKNSTCLNERVESKKKGN